MLRLARRYVAVSNSVKDESYSWSVGEIPFYCRVGVDGGFGLRALRVNSRERIEFLAREKNSMMNEALARFSAVTHVLSIESWYLEYAESIRKLLSMYDRLDNDDLILGSPVWCRIKTKLFENREVFYDGWACPELAGIERKDFPRAELVEVSGVGSCFVFPKWVWERYGFSNPASLDDGFFYSELCKKSGLPVFIYRDAPVFRDGRTLDGVEYGLLKRLRISVGAGRRRIIGVKKHDQAS